MENEEVKTSKFDRKKVVIVGIAMGLLVFVIIIISLLVIPKDQRPLTQENEEQVDMITTQAEFIPPLHAVESNAPATFNSKLVFSENIPATKITVEVSVDPNLASDVLLGLVDFESWTIESGSYDAATGIAVLILMPSTGLGSANIRDAVITVDPTSKDNIQNKEAVLALTPNSVITAADGNQVQIKGNTLKLIYPNIAPLVE